MRERDIEAKIYQHMKVKIRQHIKVNGVRISGYSMINKDNMQHAGHISSGQQKKGH
jgi:hypothetical protein